MAWIPDSKQRATIQSLASFGLSATEIAAVLDCGATEKAVQSLCSREIALGEARAKAKLRQTLFSEATNGNSQALLHMVKERDRNADLCDSAELCSWLCCSRETLSNLVKSGVIERVSRGVWDRRQCVQRVVTHLRAIAAGRSSGEGGDTDLSAERSKLTAAQCEGQELKNAQLRRELAPISLLSWTLGKVGNQIGAVLDSIPLKVKKVVPRLTAVEVEHIKREVVKAQNAASRITVDLDEYYDERDARSDN